jgi:signal transduction histidine kinase
MQRKFIIFDESAENLTINTIYGYARYLEQNSDDPEFDAETLRRMLMSSGHMKYETEYLEKIKTIISNLKNRAKSEITVASSSLTINEMLNNLKNILNYHFNQKNIGDTYDFYFPEAILKQIMDLFSRTLISLNNEITAGSYTPRIGGGITEELPDTIVMSNVFGKEANETISGMKKTGKDKISVSLRKILQEYKSFQAYQMAHKLDLTVVCLKSHRNIAPDNILYTILSNDKATRITSKLTAAKEITNIIDFKTGVQKYIGTKAYRLLKFKDESKRDWAEDSEVHLWDHKNNIDIGKFIVKEKKLQSPLDMQITIEQDHTRTEAGGSNNYFVVSLFINNDILLGSTLIKLGNLSFSNIKDVEPLLKDIGNIKNMLITTIEDYINKHETENKLLSTQTELTKEKQEKEKFSKELDLLRDDIKNNLEVGGVLHDTINNFDRIKSLANRINRALVENPSDPELLELSKKLNTLIQEAMRTIVVSQNELKGKKTKDTVFYSLSKIQGKVARKYERDYLVPYNITFDITPNEEADMIPLGVVMLSRFIENLFLNSFRILSDYETDEQKKILIYSEEKSLKLGKEAREPQKYIVVHFIDNGPGIPNERKEKIFQPGGDSTKEDKQGEHGVALPYMRKKMKEIGGYVREVGIPGEGAHFELFFPKLSPAELKEEARKNPGEARLTHDLSNAKILILDDHTEILDKYISIYSKFGSELKTGLNGKEGLAILDSGFIPDFIQSDIEMDLMRGEVFIKEVRQRGHQMPIMVITGNEEYIDENTGDLNEDKGMDLLEIGVNDIIIRDKAEEKIILEKAQSLLVRYLFKN